MVKLKRFVTRNEGRDMIQSHLSLYADIAPTQDWYDHAYRKVLQIHSNTWTHHRIALGVVGHALFNDRPSFSYRENAPVTKAPVIMADGETVDDSIARLSRDFIMTDKNDPLDYAGINRLSDGLQYQIAQLMKQHMPNPSIRLIMVDCFHPDNTTVYVGLNRT